MTMTLLKKICQLSQMYHLLRYDNGHGLFQFNLSRSLYSIQSESKRRHSAYDEAFKLNFIENAEANKNFTAAHIFV